MESSDIAFRNSIDEELNIESWISSTQNFVQKNDIGCPVSLDKKKGVGTEYVKSDKRNLINVIAKSMKVKIKKKVSNRNIRDIRTDNVRTSLGGRASSILSIPKVITKSLKFK